MMRWMAAPLRMQGWLARFIRSGAAMLCLAVILPARAQTPAPAPEENTGPNINLQRQASGKYLYRTLMDGRERGTEEFTLLVHGDGSRTLMIWHDLWARNAQFSVVLRVAADFRPLSAFASYWVASGYKGNTTFQVDGNKLTAAGVSAGGMVAQELEVPEHFSIGSHPVAGDGWHFWYANKESAKELTDKPRVINLFSLEASPDIDKPVLGQLVEMPYEYVGIETVDVPAGRFEAEHYRLMGATDLWFSGPDRLVVRMVQPKFDREYLLTELRTLPAKPEARSSVSPASRQ